MIAVLSLVTCVVGTGFCIGLLVFSRTPLRRRFWPSSFGSVLPTSYVSFWFLLTLYI